MFSKEKMKDSTFLQSMHASSAMTKKKDRTIKAVTSDYFTSDESTDYFLLLGNNFSTIS